MYKVLLVSFQSSYHGICGILLSPVSREFTNDPNKRLHWDCNEWTILLSAFILLSDQNRVDYPISWLMFIGIS